MVNSLQQTASADVDAVPETVVAESQVPAGTANSALPMVGTNKVSQWATWDPNLWWTDWTLPADPRPSWERWFDWVNQLKTLVPALGEASKDWQAMIGQFDNSLRTVQGMRADLANWTGPSAQTMSASLDRLENSITTRTNAIRDNPAKLQQLAQTINDAVAPMSALDAEYQQVLNDLVACRQVAERGKPIMLNLATTLLRTGTDLENSVQSENLAPQPVPPQQVALTEGAQGPTQRLTQVAGAANLADPGNVTPASQVAVAHQPTVAGPANLADPGQVQVAQQAGVAHVPGVAVTPSDPSAANLALPGQSTASPTLAGVSVGSSAPAVPTAPTALTGPPAMPTPTPSPTVLAMPMTPATGAPAPRATGAPAPPAAVAPASPAEERTDAVAVVAVPMGPVQTSGVVGVPTSLRGRAAAGPPPVIIGISLRGKEKPRPDADEPGAGVVTGRPPRA